MYRIMSRYYTAQKSVSCLLSKNSSKRPDAFWCALNRGSRAFSGCCAVMALLVLAGCGSYRSNQQTPELDGGVVEFRSNGPNLSTANALDPGLMMPDGRGGYILIPGAERKPQSPNVVEAQELRLRVKELVSQLFETRSNDLLTGMVALPTSFVNLNDFSDTSPLGRYMAEAMFHEFNQRGFPVREYRLDGKIHMQPMQGEFALTRSLPPLAYNQSYSAVLVGTYLKDNNAFFVNVRLVRPDGLVLRTGQLVFGSNPLLASMTAKPPPPVLPPISSGTLRINSRNVTGTPARSSQRSTRVKPSAHNDLEALFAPYRNAPFKTLQTA